MHVSSPRHHKKYLAFQRTYSSRKFEFLNITVKETNRINGAGFASSHRTLEEKDRWHYYLEKLEEKRGSYIDLASLQEGKRVAH